MRRLRSIRRPFFAFLGAAVLLCGIFAALGFVPFGGRSLLINDLNIQYVEYLKYLHTVVTGQNSLTYAQAAGMGGSFIPIFSYYCSSPLQLLLALLPNDAILLSVSLATLLKLSLSCGTMMFYLEDRFGPRRVHGLFALSYALSGAALAYSQCLMWLDGLIWLPMVLSGVEQILRGKSAKGFTLAVAASVFSNYYTAIMGLMFACLMALTRYFSEDQHAVSFWTVLKKGILGMAIGLACNGWLLMPSFLSVINNRLAQPAEALPLFSFARLAGLNNAFPGVPAVTLGQEITFDYAGLLCLILVFSSFFQRLRSNRKKLVDGLTLLFFAASVFFTPLYKLWHFLSMPYGFPTRFSFVIVFWLIAAAADAWDTRDKKSLVCGAFVVLLLLVANGTMTLPAKLITAGFIAGITALLCLGFQKVLAVTVAAELTFAGAATFISLDRDNVYDGYASAQTVLDYQNEVRTALASFASEPGYRIENLSARNQNEGLGYNYPSISHYSSTYDKKVSDFLEHYGVSHRMFGSTYHGTTLALDAFLGIRYVLREKGAVHVQVQTDHYRKIAETETFEVLENPYALPLGFVIDDHDETPVPQTYSIAAQNELVRLCGGEPLITRLDDPDLFVWDGDELSRSPLIVAKRPEAETSVAIYTQSLNEEDPLYLQLPFETDETWFQLWIDQNYAQDEHTGIDAGALYLGAYPPGQDILIQLVVRDQLLRLTRAEVYSLDISALAQWTQKLQKQAAQNIQIRGSTITMHVQAEAGQRLLTTIPYDKGWHAEIDGQPAAVTPFQNTFIELPLSEGTHEIKLVFRPRGLTLGLVITAGGILTALACAGAERKKRTEKSRL